MNEILPNLERLSVYYYRGEELFEGSDIHFENLKYFHLEQAPRFVERILINCTTLEELRTNYVSIWLDVVAQNKNLTKIITCLDDDELDAFELIAKDLPKLKQLINMYH